MVRTPVPKAAPSPETPKTPDLSGIITDVTKSLGDQLVVLKDVERWIPTRIPQVDIAMGGGLPVGRLVTVIGKKSVGKSTFTVHCMVRVQQEGGIPLGLDAERSNLKSRCLRQGLQEDQFLPCQPESLDSFEREDYKTGKKIKVKGAFDIAEDVIKTMYRRSPETLMAVVLDSVAGSTVAKEAEGDVGSAQYGRHSLILSQAFRKIMPMVHDLNIVFLLVNQTKQKVGVTFGNPDTYIGKNPIDFHSAITIEMNYGGLWPKKEGLKKEDAEGIITRMYMSKNKVARPFLSCEYVTFFDRGIDILFENVCWLNDQGFFGSASGWYSWGGKNYRLQDLLDLFRADPAAQRDLLAESERKVNEILGNTVHAAGAQVLAKAS